MAKHLLTACLLATLFIAPGCGGARPYSLMYKSASSELTATAQARDHRLKANLRAARRRRGVSRLDPLAGCGHGARLRNRSGRNL